MKQVNKLKQLSNLSYFDLETLAQVTELEGNTLYKNISRWIKQGSIIQLKRGLYTTQNFASKQDAGSYLEFISNKLRYPSYLSLEYVLGKYQILTESVYTYTSVTQKSTRVYTNTLGVFSYRSISSVLFTGFKIVRDNNFEIAIATKSKALFDFLYLKLYRKSEITKTMIDDLRLNVDEFTKADKAEFLDFCTSTGIRKFSTLDVLLFN
ncbi:MAG: hypothetical protein Q8P72_02390 [Candidatus Roizmanbacteria bacterium]|nr:hypothetical protein [Candidatus Roizmanbacteria bacterium]